MKASALTMHAPCDSKPIAAKKKTGMLEHRAKDAGAGAGAAGLNKLTFVEDPGASETKKKKSSCC